MHMRGDEACKVLCDPLTLDAAKAKKFQTRVEEEYRVNMCAFVCCAWVALLHSGDIHLHTLHRT